MSGDELFCLVVSVVMAWVCWRRWVSLLFNQPAFAHGGGQVALYGWLVPAGACVGLLVVLCTISSYDVRSSFTYTLFYLVMGIAWVGCTVSAASALDFVVRDDWIERRNLAAVAAGSGLILGATAAFAGGNIGDGPGWWVVFFSAALSTGAMFLGLAAFTVAANVLERITVERDVGLGVRIGGYLLMAGVIGGRAVAGDWVSPVATIDDYVVNAWPLLPLTLALCLFERFVRGNKMSVGVSACIVFLEMVLAVALLVAAGMW